MPIRFDRNGWAWLGAGGWGGLVVFWVELAGGLGWAWTRMTEGEGP